jgi:hypothetical protein
MKRHKKNRMIYNQDMEGGEGIKPTLKGTLVNKDKDGVESKLKGSLWNVAKKQETPTEQPKLRGTLVEKFNTTSSTEMQEIDEKQVEERIAYLNEVVVPLAKEHGRLGHVLGGQSPQGTGLLNNHLYIGEYVWNRCRWGKDPETGKTSKERDGAEGQTVEVGIAELLDDGITGLELNSRYVLNFDGQN